MDSRHYTMPYKMQCKLNVHFKGGQDIWQWLEIVEISHKKVSLFHVLICVRLAKDRYTKRGSTGGCKNDHNFSLMLGKTLSIP